MRSPIVAIAFIALTSNAHGQSQNSVPCFLKTPHPVCIASFRIDPSGTLGDTGTSKGIALLDGYQVRFLCSAGAANRKKPRVCQWQKVKP